MADFLSRLRQRRQAMGAKHDQPGVDAAALTYAEVLLQRERLRSDDWKLPPQLMVVGPTQSGKSTVCNLLLGSESATPSPLAGYTRQAQGFVTAPVSSVMESALVWQFGHGKRPEAGSSSKTGRDAYSLTAVAAAGSFIAEPLIVWDTPDFDSVNSRDYRDLVPTVCALADAILLVVSREKYADQSVWHLLRMIAPIHLPLLICLNKTSVADEAALRNALDQRLQQEQIHHAGTVAIPYSGNPGQLAGSQATALLRERAAALLAAEPAAIPPVQLHDLISRHWSAWTGPLQRELVAGSWWQSELEAGLSEALGIYQRDYLHNPHYSDSLQRAVLSLLELLEVPGAAAALVRLRKLLTWPARKLQDLFKQHFPAAGKGDSNQEAKLLTEAASHLILAMRHRIGEQSVAATDTSSRWWRNLADRLELEAEPLQNAFNQAIDAYQVDFERDIRAAGERLYRYLEGHPATLNSLRAARVTTDAAAIALAIKTGGIGLNDLILAPAMLSFVSLLTEGALGRYMHGVEQDLKAQQLTAVDTQLFAGVLYSTLIDLPQRMSAEGCYAIPQSALAEAEQALEVLAS